MKNHRIPTLIILFVGFLLSGFWVGQQIQNLYIGNQPSANRINSKSIIIDVSTKGVVFQPEANSQAQSQIPLPPLPANHLEEQKAHSTNTIPKIHQQNILVIGVDRLDAPTPNLVSVWLIIGMPNSPHLMLLPIYPDPVPALGNSSSTGEKLASIFQLDANQSPHPSFFDALQTLDLWWNAYILLDETALAEVIGFTGSFSNISQNEAKIVENVPDPWSDPLGALFGQAEIVQNLCRRTALMSTVANWQYLNLYETIQEHIRSDLDVKSIISAWQGLLAQGGRISCEFPTLAAPLYRP